MRKRLENKFKMILTVLQILSDREELWKTNVPIKTAITELNKGKGKAEKLIQKQEMLKKPSGDAKLNQKKLVTDLLLPIIGAIYAWAADTNNEELKQKFSLSKKNLLKGREMVVVERLLGILDMIIPYTESLIPYGITEEMISECYSAIMLFKAMLPKSREKQKVLKTVTEQLKNEIDDCVVTLEERIDKMMLNYKMPQPDFYTEYTNARIIGGWEKKEENN
ncbi:MAG TPA: hypothetical protein PLG86_04910, partial [Bacteroidales bacterium]|nr:hypothetical protein [Bacteroidales bacterium]